MLDTSKRIKELNQPNYQTDDHSLARSTDLNIYFPIKRTASWRMQHQDRSIVGSNVPVWRIDRVAAEAPSKAAEKADLSKIMNLNLWVDRFVLLT